LAVIGFLSLSFYSPSKLAKLAKLVKEKPGDFGIPD